MCKYYNMMLESILAYQDFHTPNFKQISVDIFKMR